MAQEPFTWKPEYIIEVTNTSDQNLLLELESGLLRLDAGRTLLLTDSAYEQPKFKALLNDGLISVRRVNKR